MPICEGLPDGPCPQKSRGKDVKFRYAELNLCAMCEMTRREQDGAFISKSLMEETAQKKGKGPGNLNDSVLQNANKANSSMGTADLSLQGVLGAWGGPGTYNTDLNNFSEDSDNDDVTSVKQRHCDKKTVSQSHQALFLQPLVAYMIYSFQSSSFDNINIAVMGHFSLEQIIGAKKDLWDFCGPDIIGEKFNRKNTNNRSMAEAHVTDILNAIVKLDKAEKLPLTVIDTASLGIIPRSHPEELNNISLCDRLNKLETRMLSMQIAMDKTMAKNFELEERISHMDSYAGVLSKRRSQGEQNKTVLNLPKNKNTSNTPSNSVDTTTSAHSGQFNAMASQNTLVENSVSLSETAVGNITATEASRSGQNPPIEVLSTQENVPGSLDGDFQFPKEQTKRIRRQERRKNIVQGCANISNCKIKGAPEPERSLFIYRVDKDTDKEDLTEYISQQGFLVRQLQCVSKPESKFLSFKLTVPISQFKKLFNPSLWPEGIRIRKFVVNNRGNNNPKNTDQT